MPRGAEGRRRPAAVLKSRPPRASIAIQALVCMSRLFDVSTGRERMNGSSVHKTWSALLLVCQFGCGGCPAVTQFPEGYQADSSGTATLVGAAESGGGAGRVTMASTGRFVAVDGKPVDVCPESSIELAARCHLVEAEFDFSMTKRTTPGQRKSRTDPDCPPLAICQKKTNYESGRMLFAVPMVAGRRYELNALIDLDSVDTYIVEIDDTEGTLAKYLPAPKGTKTCDANPTG